MSYRPEPAPPATAILCRLCGCQTWNTDRLCNPCGQMLSAAREQPAHRIGAAG